MSKLIQPEYPGDTKPILVELRKLLVNDLNGILKDVVNTKLNDLIETISHAERYREWYWEYELDEEDDNGSNAEVQLDLYLDYIKILPENIYNNIFLRFGHDIDESTDRYYLFGYFRLPHSVNRKEMLQILSKLKLTEMGTGPQTLKGIVSSERAKYFRSFRDDWFTRYCTHPDDSARKKCYKCSITYHDFGTWKNKHK